MLVYLDVMVYVCRVYTYVGVFAYVEVYSFVGDIRMLDHGVYYVCCGIS